MVVEPAAILIGLREGLEALLIVGILLGVLRRLGHPEKGRLVWYGLAGGIVASVAVGLVVNAFVATWFESQGGAAYFEIVVALAAVGVLTYMVIWMHNHAREMVGQMRERVAQATRTGKWYAIGALAFVTVLREGVETVLFFQALSAQSPWRDLIVSGVVGLAISAAIAYAIFRMTVEIDVRRFFGVTGLLLILIAAGLLVHVGHAAADVGLVPHGEPLWDTSPVLPDDGHWLGGPLHAFIGYEDAPTLLQLVLYVTYLVGVGGWYLASLARPERQARSRRLAAAALILLLLGFSVAGAVTGPGDGERLEASAHGHGPNLASGATDDHARLLDDARAAVTGHEGRVGVLIRDHGEVVSYNASTYASIKAFIEAIWPYTGLPRELLLVDQGTLFIDDERPHGTEPRADPALVDAWLSPWELPAVPATDPVGTGVMDGFIDGQYYLAPGTGPGLGEGDLFELFGLGVYRDYLKMENHSPRYEQGLSAQLALRERLSELFGDQVVVAFAHGIDPGMGPEASYEHAARALTEAGVDLVLDAYQSSVHSDAMNTCMMAPHAEHALREAGYDGPIVPVGMAGLRAPWAEATATYVAELVASVPDDTPVSVHLTQHGARPGSPNPCGSGADQYHDNLHAQFEAVAPVVREALHHRDEAGTLVVRHVYGTGADAADDGELSPLEALEADVGDGVGHVVIVPYEFWGDSLDNLVYLRESLGFEAHQAPYYGPGYGTWTSHKGMTVHVASAHFGTTLKAEAQVQAVAAALLEALGPR